LQPSLLGVKSRSCHDPSCFCHAKNVEAHDVVVRSSAFGTRPAIVHYLQNNHKEDKSFNSIYFHGSKSISFIHSQIGLTGRYLFIKLAKWIKDQNSHNLEVINKTDCLMVLLLAKHRQANHVLVLHVALARCIPHQTHSVKEPTSAKKEIFKLG
jgi:hypothetical protein